MLGQFDVGLVSWAACGLGFSRIGSILNDM